MIDSLKKSLSLNLFFTLLSTGSTFVLLKILFMYFDYEKDEYGLWLIVYSILSYIYIMDFGISNGLRNILAPLIKKNDKKNIDTYLSNSMIITTIITIFLLIILNSFFYIAPQYIFFNGVIKIGTFKKFLLIILNLQIIYFYVSCLKPIFHAYNKSYLVNLCQALSNALTILILYTMIILKTNHSWFLLAYVYVLPQIIAVVIVSYIMIKEKNLKFHIKLNKVIIKNLFSIGLKFIYLQFSNLILFNSLPIIIGMVCSYNEVSQFQLSSKLMAVFIMVFNIIMAPIWTILLYENENKNFNNIGKIFHKLIKTIIAFSAIIILFSFLQNVIITIWMGKNFDISLTTCLIIALYTICNIICIVMQSFLNGLNIFKSQIYGYLLGSFYLIIISYVMTLINIKSLNVLLVNATISLIIPSITMLYSYKKFITKGE